LNWHGLPDYLDRNAVVFKTPKSEIGSLERSVAERIVSERQMILPLVPATVASTLFTPYGHHRLDITEMPQKGNPLSQFHLNKIYF
jgi:hypothetical protein